LAWVSSYNSRCGIASYSAHLIERLRELYDIRVYADRGSSPIDGSIESSIVRCGVVDWIVIY